RLGGNWGPVDQPVCRERRGGPAACAGKIARASRRDPEARGAILDPLLPLPQGTVTFLFTDIEGSTRLLQQLGDQSADLLAAQRRLLRAVFQEHTGHELGTEGDSFFVAFSRAVDAVASAVAGQRALNAHPWPAGASVRVRMGLHTGEPTLTPEGYVGLD